MDEIRYFQYGDKEIAYLKNADPLLGNIIDEIGPIKREVIPDLFTALVHAIVGQQISTKAHQTVWVRLLEQVTPMTPQRVGELPLSQLQSCGISERKARYLKEIVEAVSCGRFDLAALEGESDDMVRRRLCELKGVGVWTAEMLMIFSMQRGDILSFGDMGILRGMRMLYQHQEITKNLFQQYKARYAPYGTVAGFYLWAIAGGACPRLVDPAKVS